MNMAIVTHATAQRWALLRLQCISLGVFAGGAAAGPFHTRHAAPARTLLVQEVSGARRPCLGLCASQSQGVWGSESLTTRDFQNCSREWQARRDPCAQSEGEGFEGGSWPCVFHCNTFFKFQLSLYVLITPQILSSRLSP